MKKAARSRLFHLNFYRIHPILDSKTEVIIHDPDLVSSHRISDRIGIPHLVLSQEIDRTLCPAVE
jgi:hypothetical protein